MKKLTKKMLMGPIMGLVVGLGVAFFLAAPAQAVTMNFNAGSGRPVSYTENGMTVTSLHVGGTSAPHLHLNNATLRNHSRCCSTPYEFTFSGGLFDLVSFDVLSGGSSSTFVSNLGGSESLVGLGTHTLSGSQWSGMTSFLWMNSVSSTKIDNLVFNAHTAAVPEPSTILLFGSGLAALGAWRMKKRKQTV